MLAAAHDRNLVGLEELAEAGRRPGRRLGALGGAANPWRPRSHRGLPSSHCRGWAATPRSTSSRDAWELLEAAGAAERVIVDFSVMRSFDYYTGLVAEAYAPGLGLPLGGGGRYDGVLAAFDAPAPAAGFALGLERVMIALMEQGAAVDVRALDAVVGGDAAAALGVARSLRAAGWRGRAVAARRAPSSCARPSGSERPRRCSRRTGRADRAARPSRRAGAAA